MRRKIITLLSDFGTKDGYAGSMKGVIKAALPEADIIDISHDIAPFDVNEAAYCLYSYYSSFPTGTVHLAVVDPGVGSGRKGIIIKTDKYYFIGPHNGLFKLILYFEKCSVYEILMDDAVKYSATFHGRDLFAPAAAKIAAGLDINMFADEIKKFNIPSSLYSIDKKNRVIAAKALTVDRFGNIITPLSKNDLLASDRNIEEVTVKGIKLNTIRSFYDENKRGRLLLLWNSLGFLEISANRASAVELIQFNKISDTIHIKLK